MIIHMTHMARDTNTVHDARYVYS